LPNASTPGKLTGIVFLLLLAVTALIYLPGLSGAFLLDDSINLGPLQGIHDPADLYQLTQYSLSGMAGGLGRPLSLATFSLQYYSWPSDPGAFKYVNLAIHLLNGCLLFWLLLRLTELIALPRREAVLASLLAAGLWLIHPLQVSTVLYVVQRMTELSALFSLAGLLAYVVGRKRVINGATISGYAWMSLGVGLGTLLATLSKENGALLPLLILVLEFTLFAGLPRPRHWRAWRALFLYLPNLLLIGLFAQRFDALVLGTYHIRDFTLSERLLTESRVLMDYLGKLFFPVSQSFTVFHDDYPVSRGLLAPPQTLASVFGIVALLGSAFWLRRQLPVYSFAVLWFFAGQILESSFIPLELYYEHRNYLPIAGVLFAAVYYVLQLRRAITDRHLRYLAASVGALLLAVFSALAWQETRLWGQPLMQANIWSIEHPESKRALEWAGSMWAMSGNGDWAAATYSRMTKVDPADAAGDVFLLHLGCYYNDVRQPDRGDLVERLKTSKVSTGAMSALDGVISLKESNGCARVHNGDLAMYLDALMSNPRFDKRRANLLFMQGRLREVNGDTPGAVAALDQAYILLPRVQTILLQVNWLAGAGRYDEARAYLAKARDANSRYRGLQREVQAREIADLEKTIRERPNAPLHRASIN
jgi:tetratricopeptide (TPR) repeat protein